MDKDTVANDVRLVGVERAIVARVTVARRKEEDGERDMTRMVVMWLLFYDLVWGSLLLCMLSLF